MAEFGIENFKSLEDFKVENIVEGTKPVLVFDGELWENDHQYGRIRNLLIEMFQRDVVQSEKLQGLEHVLSFTAVENKIVLRSYRVMNESGTRIPRIELNQIEPSLNINVRRTELASQRNSQGTAQGNPPITPQGNPPITPQGNPPRTPQGNPPRTPQGNALSSAMTYPAYFVGILLVSLFGTTFCGSFGFLIGVIYGDYLIAINLSAYGALFGAVFGALIGALVSALCNTSPRIALLMALLIIILLILFIISI